VTELGSGIVITLVGVAAAVILAVRRRYEELGVLVFALLALAIAVPELKDAIGRPRPAGALIDVRAESYPSAHAAYSVLYSWLALIIAIRLRPTWGGATALLVGGILLTAAIGLSRVYLGAHYLSDVSGGWAFGVCAFAIGTVIAVVVSHLRQNSGSGA
jgi:undecaprenyl-diphosphatase